ncbi:MAG: protein kinase domain-containing protein, partial [Thermoanaerobaculia bacterium]
MVATAQTGRITRVLGGRFRIVRLLGEGTLAEVFEADDLLLGGRVAVKRLRPVWARDPRLVERCKREVLSARRIGHPNVCRVFDLLVGGGGADEPELLLAMELVGGETLAARLSERERLPAEEVLPIARQLCAGLEAAHAAGVVHRDLKPANVLLEPRAGGGERVVITDLGTARQLSGPGATLTAPGDLLGSPAYVAPEQLEGEAVTPAADLFSLGVLLYEALTGVLPFEGETAFETAMARLHRAPPAPGALVPALDPLWDRVILCCLARDAGERYSGAGEVAEALADGRRRRPSGGRFTRGLRPVPRAGLGSRGLVLPALSAFLVTVTVLVLGAVAGPRDPGPVAAEPAAGAGPSDTASEGAAEGLDELLDEAHEHLAAGELDGAAALFQEALDRARDAGDERWVARGLAGLALVHSRRRDLAQAARLNRQALWHMRRVGDQRGVAILLNNLGAVLVQEGRLREAEAFYREAATAYAAAGSPGGVAVALNNRGELLLRQGHLGDAEELYHRALERRRVAEDPRGEALTLLGLARLDLERSRPGDAEARSDRALELFDEAGYPDGVSEARIVHAQAALLRGDPGKGRRLLEAAQAADPEGSGSRRHVTVLTLLSAAALADGEPERAEALARDALRAAEEAFHPEGRTRALLALGAALTAAGSHAEALPVLERARGTEWGRQDRRLQLRLAVATARAEAASGRHGDARRR